MATKHPAVEYRNEPAFQAIVSSEKYGKLTPEKRRELLGVLGEMTAEERQGLASELTRDPGLPSEANETMLRGIQSDTPDIDVLTEEQKLQRGKTQLATGVGMAIGGGIPAALGVGAGSGILATTGANVLGNVVAGKVNKTLGLEPGSPEGWDLSDTLNAAGPLLAGVGRGVKHYLTKPAQQAVQHADDLNVQRTGDYRQKVSEISADTQERVARLEDQIDTRNTSALRAHERKVEDVNRYNATESGRVQMENYQSQHDYARASDQARLAKEAEILQTKVDAARQTQTNRQAWQAKGEEITRDFQREMQDISRRHDLSQAQKTKLYQERSLAYQERKAAHNAARGTYERATEGMDIPDPKPAYKASAEAAELAQPVNVKPLGPTFKDAQRFLEGPVDPNNPMSRVATNLKAWSEGGPVPIDEVLSVHQDLGKVVGNTTGKQKKVATDLYKRVEKVASDHAATDPYAAEAIEKHFQGQAEFKRQQSFLELKEIFDTKVTDPAPGQSHANTPAIRAKLKELFKPGGFAANAITPEEQDAIWAEVDKLPTQPVGRAPQPPRAGQPDYSQAEIKRDRALADLGPEPEAVQPDMSRVRPVQLPDKPTTKLPNLKDTPEAPAPEAVPYDDVKPNWPDVPETAQPDVGKFPVGKFIMTKVFGSELGARLYGVEGSMPALGLEVALGGVFVPHWVSRALTKDTSLTNRVLKNFGITNQEVVRGIASGQREATPQQIAVLTTLARKLGGKPDEETVK